MEWQTTISGESPSLSGHCCDGGDISGENQQEQDQGQEDIEPLRSCICECILERRRSTDGIIKIADSEEHGDEHYEPQNGVIQVSIDHAFWEHR